MIYYGIKPPINERGKSYISWVEKSEHESWVKFFNQVPYIHDAIKAAKAMGFKCVKLNVAEIEE